VALWQRSEASSASARFFIGALILLVSIGLFGLGVLLSNTYGAAQVAGNARKLHWVNATLGASGIARASIAQAVFFSFENVSDEVGKTRAVDEARANLAGVGELAHSPEAFGDIETIEQFVSAGRAAVDLAESASSSMAEASRVGGVEPVFAALESDLLARQTTLVEAIAESDELGGRISRITFVAISFAIPAVTMVVFWLLLRRRVREREHLMEARLESERELGRAKDEFIAGLSHELRTPLTTIVGFSELLIEDRRTDDDSREQLGIIHSSASDLSRMVGDLLVAARLEADALTVSPEVVDLGDVVTSSTASYVLAGEDIKVKVPSLSVYADPLHLRQVVHNLVSNALRHGGERILVTATESGGSVSLVVADDGPGIPEDLEPRLFKRFMHEGREALLAGSVGLGLAISQELARRMNGALLYRRTGGWTTFTLKLPSVPKREMTPISVGLVGAKASL
jgi:signal transduction histidine kinase